MRALNAPAYAWTDEQKKFLAALAKDLKANAGKSAVIPGLYQDPSVAALALASTMRSATWARRLSYSAVSANPLPTDQLADFKALVADLNAGKVDWLVILNANPIYAAPADLDFATRSTRQRSSRISARMSTRRGRFRTGIFRRRIIWSRGRTRGPTTARFRSCSR